MVALLVMDMGLSTLQWHRVPVTPCDPLSPCHSQHVFPEAALPLGLVEEVVEVAAKGDEDKTKGQEAEDAWKRRGTSLVTPGLCHHHHHHSLLCDFRGQNVPVPSPIPSEPSPRRSMVSLILLAAFSLSSPGWLLLMEKSVMTPVGEDEGVRLWGHPR